MKIMKRFERKLEDIYPIAFEEDTLKKLNF